MVFPSFGKNFPILVDVNNFLVEFNNTFSDTNQVQTTKLQSLHQKSRAASTYVTNFQLSANDIN